MMRSFKDTINKAAMLANGVAPAYYYLLLDILKKGKKRNKKKSGCAVVVLSMLTCFSMKR